MRLVNYGVGEITDRLTILSLKILVGKEKGRPTDHFETEQTALVQQVRARTLNATWFEQVLELAAVNGQLWHAEDQLRWDRQQCAAHPTLLENPPVVSAIAERAFRIQQLNDRRAELITLINMNAGDAVGPEKLS